MPMAAARWRWDAALIESRGNAVQARYARRSQLCDDWRQFRRGSVRARHAGFVGDALGAVPHVATGWHHGSMPIAH
jgi:hypothetical protein